MVWSPSRLSVSKYKVCSPYSFGHQRLISSELTSNLTLAFPSEPILEQSIILIIYCREKKIQSSVVILYRQQPQVGLTTSSILKHGYRCVYAALHWHLAGSCLKTIKARIESLNSWFHVGLAWGSRPSFSLGLLDGHSLRSSNSAF